jgi:predicted HicB family RNase H-like nuclease
MSKSDYKTVKISPELHKKIKMYCVENDIKLNVWIEEKLEKIINDYGKKENLD